MGVNSAIFNHPTAIALVQLGAIVGGHVFGIVCAHEKAVALAAAGSRASWSVAVAAGDGRLYLRRTGAVVLPLSLLLRLGTPEIRVSDQGGVLDLRSETHPSNFRPVRSFGRTR